MTHFTYVQRTGDLYDPDGTFMARGYSGDAANFNNPAAQALRAEGPIPVGAYTIGDPIDPPDHLGPLAMPLTPNAGTNTLGRSSFFMHGDNRAANHTASHGCIIMGRAVRQAVLDSPEDQLLVVAEESDIKGSIE